jgi:pimeloyl-ACP methyl ester carboxylesterase
MAMSEITFPDGRSLEYHIIGTGGSPVLLLHGYLDSHKSFFRLFEALSARHTLYTPDQRGHGGSAEAGDYSIAGFTADAIALLEQLGLGPVHIAGHSLGGIVAQRIAAARPDLVRSLALISTARGAANNPALAEAAPLLATLEGAVPDELAREFQAATTYTILPEEVFKVYLNETSKVPLAVWRGALAGLLGEPPPPDAPQTLPALILWGENDSLFTAQDQAALRQHLPQARVQNFPETGHAPNWERPAETAAALLSFWQDLEQTP